MSKKVEIKIESILGGVSPLDYLSGDSQYSWAVAIDPEYPISDTASKSSGMIRPVGYEKFSGANVNTFPVFITSNPKTSTIYAVLSNGKIVSYDSALANEAEVSTALASCCGGAYYNDYIHITTTTNVARFGPLSGSPSLTASYWVATLSKTALENATYPALRGSAGQYPKHVMHAHIDNKLYFGDYKTGYGMIHFIKTNSSQANDGSTYEALDLPYGFYPTGIESLGNDLAIIASQTTDSNVNQGHSALFLWDTVDTSFYRVVTIPEPVL